MDPKEQIPLSEESLDTLDLDATASVDDFIKQLEEKEKDLHITADLTIEIEESEFDPRNIPDDILPDDLKTPDATQVNNSAIRHATPEVNSRIQELEKEVESLKKRLATLREERNDVQEKSDRRLKDFESFRYRVDRERRGSFIDQISNLAAQLLPVFDNLDRALDSVKDLDREKSVEFQQFYDGIALVNQQMSEIFQDMGVEKIVSVGELFDPTLHEAVALEPRADMAPNTILEELLRGYRIGNRVIRHSMVKVTTGSQSENPISEKADEVPSSPAFSSVASDETIPEPGVDTPSE